MSPAVYVEFKSENDNLSSDIKLKLYLYQSDAATAPYMFNRGPFTNYVMQLGWVGGQQKP